MKTSKTDPWNGGLYDSTEKAQRAFNSVDRYNNPEQVDWSQEYHKNAARPEDEARVSAIDGEREQIITWYWEPAYRAN